MSMVCGLDLHRGQITFGTLEEESGELWRGRLWKPDRHRLGCWLENEVGPRAGAGPVALAVEGCTGWRWRAAPVGGRSSRRSRPPGSMHMWPNPPTRRRCVAAGSTPRRIAPRRGSSEIFLMPGSCPSRGSRRNRCSSGASARGSTRVVDQRVVWVQRIHTELHQHGVALPEEHFRSENTHQLLLGTDVELSEAARQRIRVGYRMIDAIHSEAEALREQITRFGRRQKAGRALIDTIYGFGPTAAVVGVDRARRLSTFTRSRQVVRHTGPDVTVDASDTRRGGGYLSRRGPGTLRWALFEAGLCASRATSPDRDYHRSVKERHDGKLAASAWPANSRVAATTSCGPWSPTRSTPSPI